MNYLIYRRNEKSDNQLLDIEYIWFGESKSNEMKCKVLLLYLNPWIFWGNKIFLFFNLLWCFGSRLLLSSHLSNNSWSSFNDRVNEKLRIFIFTSRWGSLHKLFSIFNEKKDIYGCARKMSVYKKVTDIFLGHLVHLTQK